MAQLYVPVLRAPSVPYSSDYRCVCDVGRQAIDKRTRCSSAQIRLTTERTEIVSGEGAKIELRSMNVASRSSLVGRGRNSSAHGERAT